MAEKFTQEDLDRAQKCTNAAPYLLGRDITWLAEFAAAVRREAYERAAKECTVYADNNATIVGQIWVAKTHTADYLAERIRGLK